MKLKRLFKVFTKVERIGEVYKCAEVTPQWPQLTMAYLGLTTLTFPFVFKNRKGSLVKLNTFHDLVTVWVIFFRQEYKIQKNTKTVIDAGANIGTFSIYAIENGAQIVHAVEPFPETFALLNQNIELNHLNKKVSLHNIALASQTGVRSMDLSPGPSQSRGLLTGQDSLGIDVKTKTLDDFIDDLGLNKIDLLKMDIEGGEHEIFKNCSEKTLQKVQQIVMEYHPNGSKEELLRNITQKGFELENDFRISDQSGVFHFARLS